MSAPVTPLSVAEIVQMVQALQPVAAPAPVKSEDGDRGVTKLVVGGICTMLGAIILALIFWVGSSVNGLSTTVTKMSANVDQLQKSIADLQQTQGTAAAQLSDVRATNAKQDARQDAIDADINRIKERVRMLEGQKPLPGYDGDR